MQKKELKQILQYEKGRYFPHKRSLRQKVKQRFIWNSTDRIWLFQSCLRKLEYLAEKNGLFNHIRLHCLQRRKNKLGESLQLEIYPGCFAEGLLIWHTGIVVNSGAKIGRNCELHGNNCIGNKGSDSHGVPVLGDDVDVGFGAVIIGPVSIQDRTVIGANAVVNRSFPLAGAVLAGIPARVIKQAE